MPLFEWGDRYKVGIQRFDLEHEGLFDLMNQLHDATRAGRERGLLQGICQQLLDYTDEHFAAEEAAMRMHGFPGAEAHEAEHDEFRKKVTDFIARQRDGGGNKLGIDLVNFLLRWWTDHILRTDKKYSEFFGEKRISFTRVQANNLTTLV